MQNDSLVPKPSVLIGIFAGYAGVNFLIFWLLTNGGR